MTALDRGRVTSKSDLIEKLFENRYPSKTRQKKIRFPLHLKTPNSVLKREFQMKSTDLWMGCNI